MPVSPSRLLVRACRRHIGWLQRSQRRRNVWLLSLSFGLFLTLLLAYEKFGDHRFAKHVNRAPCNRTREETASEPAKSCAEFTSASTQLRYPTHGGALNVLCSEGYSIEQFRALAEKRLSESREAQNGAAGYAGVLRGESPCCELSAAFSFQAAYTPAHRDQSYFYEVIIRYFCLC